MVDFPTKLHHKETGVAPIPALVGIVCKGSYLRDYCDLVTVLEAVETLTIRDPEAEGLGVHIVEGRLGIGIVFLIELIKNLINGHHFLIIKKYFGQVF